MQLSLHLPSCLLVKPRVLTPNAWHCSRKTPPHSSSWTSGKQTCMGMLAYSVRQASPTPTPTPRLQGLRPCPALARELPGLMGAISMLMPFRSMCHFTHRRLSQTITNHRHSCKLRPQTQQHHLHSCNVVISWCQQPHTQPPSHSRVCDFISNHMTCSAKHELSTLTNPSTLSCYSASGVCWVLMPQQHRPWPHWPWC